MYLKKWLDIPSKVSLLFSRFFFLAKFFILIAIRGAPTTLCHLSVPSHNSAIVHHIKVLIVRPAREVKGQKLALDQNSAKKKKKKIDKNHNFETKHHVDESIQEWTK